MDVVIDPTDIRTITPDELALAAELIVARTRFNGTTLCDKIREIYAMTDDEGIRERCLVIFCYAKRMHKKLVEYKFEGRKRGEHISGNTSI